MTLNKQKTVRELTISSVKWNTIGQLGYQGFSIFVSILLARLLSPAEFGLVAMLFIFSEIANAFVNSGLSAALIQRKSISSADCSTIFYFNIGVSFLFYCILFLLAPVIARFYNEPQLVLLIKYYNLAFLIHSFSLIQATLLIKELNYKAQNIIQLIGVFFSGIVAIALAYLGFGVYSLIGQSLTFALTTGILYWLYSNWKPSLVFNKASFLEMYGFGIKVFFVVLLDKVFNAVDNLIIGKIFNANQLGIYNRAKTTKDIPINNITNILTSITYPVFSKIETIAELRKIHNQYLSLISYITMPIMVGLAITAKPFISVVFSDKWLPSVPYLQLFCLFAFIIPLNSIMVNTILSRGKSSKFLKLEVYKKLILLLSMSIGIIWGIKTFLCGLCIGYYISLFSTIHFVVRILEAPFYSIIKILIPSIFLSIFMGLFVFLMTYFPWKSNIIQLLSESLVGIFIYFLLSLFTKQKELIFIFQLIKNKFR
ncbi:MAG TPA: hypothetical protein DCQ26_01455 [Marinilabiliales bacterium]|nr:hypothetical protein [Marinilabiliales bacterium]HBO73140.1 hypothetical protein [Marinilabiliales bacterium]HBX85062.1 hypothetical protein [Marinilabiliales bacterium]HBY54886.1 hypothetical protein [Marinilabiliales bacterium]